MKYIIWIVLVLYLVSTKSLAVLDEYPGGNDTQNGIITKSSLCLYYPQSASQQMNDNSWQDTISKLLVVQGIPPGAVNFNEYVDIHSFSNNPQLECDLNVVFIEMTAQTYQLDINEIAQLLLHEWQCTPMSINMYYYQQTSKYNQWIAMGADCDIKVCALNAQTTGIGCNTADSTTFEQLTENEKLAIINVPDGVNYKLDFNTQSCTVNNCYKIGDRWNVAIIQVGGSEFFDNNDNPVRQVTSARYLRMDWKKWWQVFLIFVDYVRDIVDVMMTSSRSFTNPSWFFRG